MACTGSTAQDTITNIGDTRTVIINVVDCDGVAVDVSDYNLTYIVATSPTATATIIKTTADDISVAVDEVTVLLDVADTEDMANANYHHRLVIDDGSIFYTAMVGRHLFSHNSASCCDALTATFNATTFDYGPRLDFSKPSNSQYLFLI